MTYRALVDVNVFLDVIKKRKGWEESQKILKLFEGDDYNGWISSLTMPIIYFLSVKRIGEKSARALVVDMTTHFSEIPLRYMINEKALENNLPEYEDNIQFESACQFHLDAIITRNKKHYKQKEMDVYTPEEFIGLIGRNDSAGELYVPLMDLKVQHHEIYNEIDDRITDIIGDTGFILGKHVEEFEGAFAKAQGTKYCVGVSSGTDALHIAMMSLGIGHGDLVMVPVNTFIATAEAVSLCGAEPVFIDCETYFNIDTEKLKNQIENMDNERRNHLKAIIPVHLYGQPADMNAILTIADNYGLDVVEDCCQAHLAEYFGKKVGGFGKFGAFSFYPGKNLGSWGEAGALVTNDEELFMRSKQRRQHGEIERYHHNIVGHNYRMSAFQGATLSVKMKYIAKWTEKRKKNAKLYKKYLSNVPSVEIPDERDGCESVFHLFVIQVDNRDGLQKYLQENGIGSGLHYPVPLHLQGSYKYLGYKKGDFPVAEKAAKRILSLPMYPELEEKDIRYVCSKVAEWLNKPHGCIKNMSREV